MYQVIARKYRPQTFSELIGQGPVRTTIENAIQSHRLAHGYIFAGQRGTGKTTVARILARCLNCINGPTITPCGTCASCLEIAAGNSPDVIEIDAASNRGINEMRELRENVRYRPVRDRYKVFIIDEAHQITNEAFNALLKTLEEPPEWAIFVMCTTEAHKIPNTIASRCQQFSFRSVEFGELLTRLQEIIAAEGITADQDTLSLIAQAGEGSVRDSLSALDQAIACCGSTLETAEVRALLGMFSADSLRAVAETILDRDGERMLQVVQDMENSGQSLHHFCRELSRYWRNLLVAKIAGKTTSLIAAPPKEQEQMRATAERFSEEDLTRYLNLNLELFKSMQYSLQPRFHLELGLIKQIQAGSLRSIEQALAELGGADNGMPASATGPASKSDLARLAPPAPRTSTVASRTPPAPTESLPKPTDGLRKGDMGDRPFDSPTTEPSRIVKPAPAPAHVITAVRTEHLAAKPETTVGALSTPPELPASLPAEKPLGTAGTSGEVKAQIEAVLLEGNLKMSADAVQHSRVEVNAGEVVFYTAKLFTLGLRDSAVSRAVTKVLGKPMKVRVEVDTTMSAPTPAANPATEPPEEIAADVTEHPAVKGFLERFPGAHIRAVRKFNE